MRIPLVCLFSCVLAVDFFFWVLPPLFSISIWTAFVSSCLFLVGTMLSCCLPGFGFCCESFSILYDKYLDTYLVN